MQMWWQMYGWWNGLLVLPATVGVAVWLWLSPTAHRVLNRTDPRCRAEHRLASLRLHGRITTTEYQRAMAELAYRPSRYTSRPPSRHLV